jgi:predicted dehydrogenase
MCPRDSDTRRALSQFSESSTCTSYSDVLRDKFIHAIAIATAAENGKDVFVEKPLHPSGEKGQSLVALAKQQGRIPMVVIRIPRRFKTKRIHRQR